MGGGLALMAIPVGSWYMGFMTMKAWIAGGIGLGLFAWGLLSIGDIKNEWE